MQIVIDIPDDMDLRNYDIPYDILNIITSGIPLPKGHGDLIDRQSLIDNGIEKGFCDWYDEIKYADTIIPADKTESED